MSPEGGPELKHLQEWLDLGGRCRDWEGAMKSKQQAGL